MDLAGGDVADPSDTQRCAYLLRDIAVSGGSDGSSACPFWSELHVSL